MPNLNKINLQFGQFVKEKNEHFNSYEKKLINLIEGNLEDIINLGIPGAKRAKFLNELIEKNRDKVSEELNLVEKTNSDNKLEISRISSLEVERFRGFEGKETFLFDKSKTLVYGPNGSGKSSFCEALEYGLLGYINEADTRKIPLESYIQNINNKSKAVVKLMGANSEGGLVEVLHDPISFHFCFIEKNRLIDFGRISAGSAGEQKNLLATLFGLDDFNEFIGGFTRNITGYIPVESAKNKELEERKKELTGSMQIVAAKDENIKRISSEKSAVVVEGDGIAENFSALELYLNGGLDEGGRIAVIEKELQVAPPKEIAIGAFGEILLKISVLREDVEAFKNTDQEYQKAKDKIKLRTIFDIVQRYETLIPDMCPVCETPIKNTKVNPYENARIKLKELEQAAEIEKCWMEQWDALLHKTSDLAADIKARVAVSLELGVNITVDVGDDFQNRHLDINDSKMALEKLEALFADIEAQKVIFDALDSEIKKINSVSKGFADNKAKLNIEIIKLRKLATKIIEINAREKEVLESVDRAETAIKEFDTKNKTLIDDSKNELIVVAENAKYVDAYNSLIQKLNDYKDELPINLIRNLNELTKEFFNEINKGDKKDELLERIELPSIPGQKIKVVFQDGSNRELDPLHIMSEGHIRCLGLSILLAKAVSDNLNFIIFDDVVNAIDNEHRGYISELLFNYEKLKEKQIILTTHSLSYIKDLENNFSIEDYGNNVRQITFLKGDRRITLSLDAPMNYLLKAEKSLAVNDSNDALLNCRRALERITDVLWKRLEDENKPLSVIVRGPTSKPDLLTLVDSIRAKLEKTKDGSCTEVIEKLRWFAGLEVKNKVVWEYLNSGTHENKGAEDYDPKIVREVVDNAKILDNLSKKK